MVVVDLGAAPGGWIQAADSVLRGSGTIVGVDLLKLQQGVADGEGVQFVQGNFLDPKVQARLKEALLDMSGDTKVDLVLSDMMANTSGNNTRDGALSLELCEAALAFAVQHLSPIRRATKVVTPSGRPTAAEGSKSLPIQFIVKHFASESTEAFRKDLARYFRQVKWVKPPSSRKDSREGFFVCAGFKGKQSAETESAEQAPAQDDLESSVFF
ncbi:Ribosomal RNA large subunit methyltransferase J [Rhodotorula toruloides ATCC 204091]|uniref:rRNA methyltransferase 2, mitochondrial n=1 Tax=Rhodotorula toruloides TaxID=5286 RepID=A0A0K3C956_RHOTO|nr:Ribosomal RNA large subunit methyltransferase J [Rhodotorula toruloides ATCC 204091]PRQ76380.1 ribosomal RNA large subunit methyltransferase J [Rhodotorula toruloides]